MLRNWGTVIARVDSRRIAIFATQTGVLATWLVLAFVPGARADDCGRYLREGRNLIEAPMEVVEDCLRTGSAQAVITGVVAGIAGGAIAHALGRALRARRPGEIRDAGEADTPGPSTEAPDEVGADRFSPWDPSEAEQRRRWEEDGLIWDPDEQAFRKPRPGELRGRLPRPTDAPEELAPIERQRARHEIPGQCLKVFDAYAKAQSHAIDMDRRIREASARYQRAQDHLNKQLAKLTIKVGWDVGDLVSALPGAALDASPSKLVGKDAPGLGPRDTWRGPKGPGVVSRALEALRERVQMLAGRLAQLADEISDLGRRIADKWRAADELAGVARALRAREDELRAAIDATEARLRQLPKDLAERTARAAQQVADARTKLQEANAEVVRVLNWLESAEASQPLRQRAKSLWEAKDQATARINAAADALTQAETAAMRLAPEIAQKQREIQRRLGELADLRMDFPFGHPQYEELTRQMNDLDAEGLRLDRSLREPVEQARALLEQEQRLAEDLAKEYWEVEKELLRSYPAGSPEKVRQELEAARRAAAEAQRELDAALEGQRLPQVESPLRASLEQELQAQRDALTVAAREARDAERPAIAAAREAKELESSRGVKELERDRVRQELADAEIEANRLFEHESLPDPGTTANPVARALERAGRKWVQVFGSDQDPDEVARILMQCRAAVQSALDDLHAQEAQHTEALAEVKRRKAELDRCLATASQGG